MAATDQTTTAQTGTSKNEILAEVEDQDIQFIRLWFTDILGQLKSFAVGKDELAGALEEGMGFDGSSITGFNPIEESDMIAMPDPNTFAVLPWRPQEKAVARMFCDVLVPGGQPYEGDPRYVMRRALARASEMGFDHYYLGPELEYFYFREAELNGGPPQVLDRGGYFDLTQLDAGSDLRRDTVLALERLDIDVEYTHHEVGPSQHEIDMRYADGLRMADNAMTYRIAVKEIAMKYGVYATFMPKPLFGENGSGMHTHQSLFTNGRNVFFDPDDEYHLSSVGKAFIAGQLAHAREICALFAQWVNSYKRLVPGYEAPVYIAWSRRNRSALIRVPVYHPGKEQATRAELRCPDPACNPYLTFAGMLHAGLEGIERGYELPEPMETNLYHLSADERRKLGVEQLPETLGEAIEELASSELVLKALGEHVFSRYVELKRTEWEDYRVQVTPWELEQYLSVL
jgi:glutamine synthetase